jgi:hypothetical protein
MPLTYRLNRSENESPVAARYDIDKWYVFSESSTPHLCRMILKCTFDVQYRFNSANIPVIKKGLSCSGSSSVSQTVMVENFETEYSYSHTGPTGTVTETSGDGMDS